MPSRLLLIRKRCQRKLAQCPDWSVCYLHLQNWLLRCDPNVACTIVVGTGVWGANPCVAASSSTSGVAITTKISTTATTTTTTTATSFCPAQQAGNGDLNWPQTPAGKTVNMTCPSPGYSGIASRDCFSNGTWNDVQFPCADVFCPSTVVNNAQWPAGVQAGNIVVGSCVAGTSGQVSGTCGQNGANGVWGPFTGACSSCSPGTYQNQAGQLQCTSCPPNSGSPSGANSSSQCTCLAGYILVSGQCQGWDLLSRCFGFTFFTRCCCC